MAVKKIKVQRENDETLKETQKEIRALQGLDHKNVIQMYSHAKDKNDPSVVLIFMELMDISVKQYLKRTGPFPAHRVQKYAKQILAGLFYIHRKGLVHKDLSGST